MPTLRHLDRRRLAALALLGVTAALAACGGQTVSSDSGAAPTTAGAPATSPSTTKGAAPSSSPSTTAAAKSSTTTAKASGSTTTTAKTASTTAPSGDWPQIGDNDLQPPAGVVALGGGSVSGNLAYSIFKMPSGGYVATIGETSNDGKGRAGTRTVKAVLKLPALGAGEALAANCSTSGGGVAVAYSGPGAAGPDRSVTPTKAWLVNASPPGFTTADPSTVTCQANGN